MTETQAPSTSRSGMSIRIVWMSSTTFHGLIANRRAQAVNSFSIASGDTRPDAK